MQGSGDASAPDESHSATRLSSLNTLSVVTSTPPVVSTDASIWKTKTSGLAAVVSGAVMFTCWPRKLKPLGAVSVVPVTAMDTVPPVVPAGTTTEVAVPPGGAVVPVLTVVVLNGEAVPVAVAGGGLSACGVTASDGVDGELVPTLFVAVTVNV